MKNTSMFSKKNVLLFGGVFLLGVLILLFTEYHTTTEEENRDTIFDEAAYAAQLEERLKEMIGAVCGDENVHVFVTLDGSATYCYAEAESSGSLSSEKGLIFQQSAGGARTPVLTGITAPKIKGVSVVCKGGRNSEIRQEIIALIAGTLNLAKNRIYVTE